MSSGWAIAEIVVCGVLAAAAFVFVGWDLRRIVRRADRRVAVLQARRDRAVEDVWWRLREVEARHALALRGQRVGWGQLASEVIADATDEYLQAGVERVRKAVA